MTVTTLRLHTTSSTSSTTLSDRPSYHALHTVTSAPTQLLLLHTAQLTVSSTVVTQLLHTTQLLSVSSSTAHLVTHLLLQFISFSSVPHLVSQLLHCVTTEPSLAHEHSLDRVPCPDLCCVVPSVCWGSGICQGSQDVVLASIASWYLLCNGVSQARYTPTCCWLTDSSQITDSDLHSKNKDYCSCTRACLSYKI